MNSQRQRRRPSKFDYSRVTVTFDSGGEACEGWLYRPDRPADAPVVVMAGGLGLSRETLRPVAEQFAEHGYAAFVFDYRHVGGSEGQPRDLLSPPRQVADWEEAVGRVRGLSGVDGRRVVLWGHSFGASHALAVAADDPRVRAVVAVGPILSGMPLLRARSFPSVLKALAAGVRDKVHAAIPVLHAHRVPLAGDADELALVSDTSFKSAYCRRTNNAEATVPARVFLALARYSTPREGINCPTLLVAGTHDELAAADAIEAAAADLPDSTFLRLPATHLDLLDDEQALDHQFAFLDATVG